MSNILRKEFPRPDFERELWTNLNGEWNFIFDDEDKGISEKWYETFPKAGKIQVPFCYQCKLSGIQDISYHPVVWYNRSFEITKEMSDKTVLLKFGAVDYEADVYINSNHVKKHKGGYTQFSSDISRYIKTGENIITVRVKDDNQCDRGRGKQYWKDGTWGCWYTPVTGIWQSVWLEFTSENYIDKFRITPDIDKKEIELEVSLNDAPKKDLLIEANISYKGKHKKTVSFSGDEKINKIVIPLSEENMVDEVHYWSFGNPNLYDMTITIKTDKVSDTVKTYFGMRKIEIQNDNVFLNNKPVYLKMVLDQGYWPDSLYTPPSDEAIKQDIEMTLKFGFNGARKHQKFEDPRYYYWADRLGLLVWGEMPSGYQFNNDEIKNLTDEWSEFIEQTYNHPSVIAWVPFNESWGIRNVVADKRQQDFVRSLYYFTKTYDKTRLVSSNDGWEIINETDLFCIHDYIACGDDFKAKYSDFNSFVKGGDNIRQPLANNNEYKGQPVILSEYGGIAFLKDCEDDNWGYFGSVNDENEYLKRFEGITKAIISTKYIKGFCYTQLTDVMQEVNGLMDMYRNPKISPDKIRSILEGGYKY